MRENAKGVPDMMIDVISGTLLCFVIKKYSLIPCLDIQTVYRTD